MNNQDSTSAGSAGAATLASEAGTPGEQGSASAGFAGSATTAGDAGVQAAQGSTTAGDAGVQDLGTGGGAIPALGAGPAPAGGSLALPHGIRGAVATYPPWVVALVLLFIAALLATLGVLLARWLKRRRLNRPPQVTDPWDELQQRLRQLRPQAPFTKAAQEEYYSRLSLMLREAIERATGLPATDRTYQELRTPLRQGLPWPKEQVEALLGFLERADLVKFAAAPSGDEEALGCGLQVNAWVQQLRPAPNTDPLTEREVVLAPS